jgi:hypothetical protein
MILSILIPSTFDREAMTDKLKHELHKQAYVGGFNSLTKMDVEILTDIDNREISIGAKRQRMIEKAQGRYVVMIDSDDWVPDDYVESILKAAEESSDCICHRIECSGTPGKHENVSNKYAGWAEKHDGFDYVRTPYPKVPILRSICLEVGYKDLRYGEDHDFSIRLKESGLIKTETHLDKVLYFYRYKFAPHNQKYGIRNQRSNNQRRHR